MATTAAAATSAAAKAVPTVACLDADRIAALQKECPNFRIIRQTQQLTALMTIIRDETTGPDDFVFYADRVIRLLVEEGLEEMPHKPKLVRTPTEVNFPGVGWTLDYRTQICGVSIMRAGDSMENGLRAVCRGVKIGKILIQRNEETALPNYIYSKFPPAIAKQTVLLLDPMLATGGSAIAAIKVLLKVGVPEDKIVFINLVCCPEGVRAMFKAHPKVRIVSAALDSHLDERKYIVPGCGDFGDRYFGTT